MSDTPWTKGPWDWDYDEHDHQNAIVWLSYDANMRVCFVARCDDVEQTHANARLISAAPDMAEALVNMIAALTMAMDDLQRIAADEGNEDFNSPTMNVALADARAALAKARGTQ